jgi:hypothetical protein
VSTTEELLGRKNSGSGLDNPEYGRRDPLLSSRDTLLSAKVGINFADQRRSLSRRLRPSRLVLFFSLKRSSYVLI